ncbi:MAG: uracil-DNA glycosylase [Chloroflexi bacterium]|nr:uracil-DNA glycosylase [Chloroflexota bacterium]
MKNSWTQLNSEIVTCRLCPRLVEYRERIAREKRRAYRAWDYWGKPVPGFGDHRARVVLIGLAPGAHGSNRTGRMFTGDASGDFLYGALHRAGFANKPIAREVHDGLQLADAFITAICRCAPPANKPTPQEQANCLPFLARELELLTRARVVVAMGKIGCDGYLRLLRSQGHTLPRVKFAHGATYTLGDGLPTLICAYHPSKQNTQTGRLNAAMMDDVFRRVRRVLRHMQK